MFHVQCLLLVFENFDDCRDLIRCGAVCTIWRKASMSDNLWTRAFDNLMRRETVFFIERMKIVTNVDLVDHASIVDDSLETLASKLKSLLIIWMPTTEKRRLLKLLDFLICESIWTLHPSKRGLCLLFLLEQRELRANERLKKAQEKLLKTKVRNGVVVAPH